MFIYLYEIETKLGQANAIFNKANAQELCEPHVHMIPPYRAGPAAEAGALEFDKIDLGWDLVRSCPARGPADDDGKRSPERWTFTLAR